MKITATCWMAMAWDDMHLTHEMLSVSRPILYRYMRLHIEKVDISHPYLEGLWNYLHADTLYTLYTGETLGYVSSFLFVDEVETKAGAIEKCIVCGSGPTPDTKHVDGPFASGWFCGDTHIRKAIRINISKEECTRIYFGTPGAMRTPNAFLAIEEIDERIRSLPPVDGWVGHEGKKGEHANRLHDLFN